MHREAFLEKLHRYVPLEAADAASHRRIVAFLEEEENCFDHRHPPGHFTGSAWLLDQAGSRVLLTLHRRLGRWLQLGGHADGQADLLAVAVREAQEESGIEAIEPLSEEIFDLGVHETSGHDGLGPHLHFDIRFLLQVRGDARYKVSDESHALGWFTHDEVDALDVDEAVRRMSRKWRILHERGSIRGQR